MRCDAVWCGKGGTRSSSSSCDHDHVVTALQWRLSCWPFGTLGGSVCNFKNFLVFFDDNDPGILKLRRQTELWQLGHRCGGGGGALEPALVCVSPRPRIVRLFFWKIGSAVSPCPRQMDHVCGAEKMCLLFGTDCRVCVVWGRVLR